MGINHERRRRSIARIFILGLGATLLAAGVARRSSAASDTEYVLYSFCSTGGSNCTDGGAPSSGLMMDKAGNLYGTASIGGEHNQQAGGFGDGVVFELIPTADSKTMYTYKVLYSFCAQVKCADGEQPSGSPIMDKSGNLYGTTTEGGAAAWYGTVFELTPNKAKTAWTEKVLYSFCAEVLSCPDGYAPLAGVIMDTSGSLYGTTHYGGPLGGGTVFELTPNADKSSWAYKMLYSFCLEGIPCTDGLEPLGGLLLDAKGNLYGTTHAGGAYGGGTVFELIPNSNRTSWTHTILYSFCAQGGNSCTDGGDPSGGLIMDKSGNLYGTTSCGGAHSDVASPAGTVFELHAQTAWTYHVLYSFCAEGGTSCTDGESPEAPYGAGLSMDDSGNLYGTTVFGGAHGNGTLFKLTPNSNKNKWTEKVLYSFCSTGSDCTDGSWPAAAPVLDAYGNLLGTTSSGGAGLVKCYRDYSCGTVFKLQP